MNQQINESLDTLVSRRIYEEITIGAANMDARADEAIGIILAQGLISLYKSNKRIKAEINPDFKIGDLAFSFKEKVFPKNWEPFKWFKVVDYTINEAGQHLINEHGHTIWSEYCFKKNQNVV